MSCGFSLSRCTTSFQTTGSLSRLETEMKVSCADWGDVQDDWNKRGPSTRLSWEKYLLLM